MTTQDDTLAQLNSAKSQLNAFIISNTAQPNTPAWTALETVIQQRSQLEAEINTILAAAFQPDTPALTSAVAQLTQNTQQLTNLAKTMGTIGDLIKVAGTILQAGTAVLNVATGAKLI